MLYEKIEIRVPGMDGQAQLFTYFLGNSQEMRPGRLRPLVLVCPGGGYYKTSDREAEPIAMQFLARGCHCAVLRYSVAPHRYPTALAQLAASVKYLRENSERFGIDPDRMILQGSSAGGHLAASLGVFWKQEFLSRMLETDSGMLRPNGLILSYPVITSGEWAHRESFENLLGQEAGDEDRLREQSLELQVSEDTPPTFLWHTATDPTVPVENSILFFQALRRHQIPAELHIYPVGGHGLALANEETMRQDGFGVQRQCQSWIGLAGDWIEQSFLKYFK